MPTSITASGTGPVINIFHFAAVIGEVATGTVVVITHPCCCKQRCSCFSKRKVCYRCQHTLMECLWALGFCTRTAGLFLTCSTHPRHTRILQTVGRCCLLSINQTGCPIRQILDMTRTGNTFVYLADIGRLSTLSVARTLGRSTCTIRSCRNEFLAVVIISHKLAPTGISQTNRQWIPLRNCFVSIIANRVGAPNDTTTTITPYSLSTPVDGSCTIPRSHIAIGTSVLFAKTL